MKISLSAALTTTSTTKIMTLVSSHFKINAHVPTDTETECNNNVRKEVTTNICANNRNSCQFRNSSSFSNFLYIPPIGTFLQGTSNSVWKQFCLKARNDARHPSPLRGAPQKVLLGPRLCTRLTGYPGTKTL